MPNIQHLGMREYIGASELARNYLLPSEPGLYFWTIDFLSLLRMHPDRAVDEMQRLLQASLRPFSGRIEPYQQATLVDQSKPLSAYKESALRGILRATEPIGKEWVMMCATLIQRPLYVGKASNLSIRIEQHVRAGSRLMEYLDEAKLHLLDCCVCYLVSPVPTEASDVYVDESTGDEEEDDFGNYDFGTDPLSVAEAIVIRTSRPLLARRQE